MPNNPVLLGVVTITVRDINNNNIAKTFNSVKYINVDYYDGTINIVDSVQGSFYFGISTVTSWTVAINNNVHTTVMS